MKTLHMAVLMACCGFMPVISVAQVQKEADPTQGFKFKPVTLQVQNQDATVFGVDYEYKKSWSKIMLFEDIQPTASANAGGRSKTLFGSACGRFSEEQGPAIPRWVTFTDCAGDISLKGTLAADSKKNPNKLVDLSGSYSWMRINSDRASTRMVSLGGQTKFETDQSFDNKQFVFGLRGTYTLLAGCTPKQGEGSCIPSLDFLGISAGVQRVNPAKDSARKVALKGASLNNYERLELDAFYKYNLPAEWNYLSDIEFNYRHFQELSAPDAVRNAGLERHRLGLVRINFGLGGKGPLAVTPKMFVQYSRGSLPFDTASARVVKIGLTMQVF